MEPRIIDLRPRKLRDWMRPGYCDQWASAYSSGLGVPVLLVVSREARSVAQKHYHPDFDTKLGAGWGPVNLRPTTFPPIWLDWYHDILLPYTTLNHGKWSRSEARSSQTRSRHHMVRDLLTKKPMRRVALCIEARSVKNYLRWATKDRKSLSEIILYSDPICLTMAPASLRFRLDPVMSDPTKTCPRPVVSDSTMRLFQDLPQFIENQAYNLGTGQPRFGSELVVTFAVLGCDKMEQ